MDSSFLEKPVNRMSSNQRKKLYSMIENGETERTRRAQNKKKRQNSVDTEENGSNELVGGIDVDGDQILEEMVVRDQANSNNQEVEGAESGPDCPITNLEKLLETFSDPNKNKILNLANVNTSNERNYGSKLEQEKFPGEDKELFGSFLLQFNSFKTKTKQQETIDKTIRREMGADDTTFINDNAIPLASFYFFCHNHSPPKRCERRSISCGNTCSYAFQRDIGDSIAAIYNNLTEEEWNETFGNNLRVRRFTREQFLSPGHNIYDVLDGYQAVTVVESGFYEGMDMVEVLIIGMDGALVCILLSQAFLPQNQLLKKQSRKFTINGNTVYPVFIQLGNLPESIRCHCLFLLSPISYCLKELKGRTW